MSLDKDSDFECYDQSRGKPGPVDIAKKMAESNRPTLTHLANRSEKDEINNNGQTQDRDGNTILRRLNPLFKQPERLDSIPYF